MSYFGPGRQTNQQATGFPQSPLMLRGGKINKVPAMPRSDLLKPVIMMGKIEFLPMVGSLTILHVHLLSKTSLFLSVPWWERRL